MAACNLTIASSNCTLETCCLAQSNFLYLPSFGANLFYAIFFGVLIVPQVGLGFLYKTWGFAIGMVLGLVLEVVGYISRVEIHNSPFASNPFLIYLIMLTIAPVFISAAIYLCLTRVIVLYGTHNSRFAPRTVAITFMTSDFLSLLLQAIGGAIADIAKSGTSAQKIGIDIMIAGLVLQAISLGVFLLFGADFTWRCLHRVLDRDPEKVRVRNSMFLKAFMAAGLLATIAILIRSVFRAAELWGGFNGALWNDETDFLVLDGAMVALASVCLTALHPGAAFGGQWHAADWSFKTKKTGAESLRSEYAMESKP